MALTCEILNPTDIQANRVHKNMICRIKIADAAGGDGFGIQLSAESAQVVAQTGHLGSPSLGNVKSGTTDIVENISISTVTLQNEFAFLIKQRDMFSGDMTSIVHTVTPLDQTGTPVPGGGDTVTLTACSNYDDLGHISREKLMIGAGTIMINGRDIGFFTDDGFELTPSHEIRQIKPGNKKGYVAASPTLTEWVAKFTLLQMEPGDLLTWAGLTGNRVTRSSSIRDFGTDRSGEYIDIVAPGTWCPEFALWVQGDAQLLSKKDFGITFDRCFLKNSGSLLLQALKEAMVQVEVGILLDPQTDKFFRMLFLDAN